MTADPYVESILAKYEVARGPTSYAERLGTVVAGPLRTWAGQQLNTLQCSRSYAKETSVHGVSDVDEFISLKSATASSYLRLFCEAISESDDAKIRRRLRPDRGLARRGGPSAPRAASGSDVREGCGPRLPADPHDRAGELGAFVGCLTSA